MQIAKEVGFKRILKYALFTGWQTVFNLLPFSPLRIWWMRLWGADIGANTVIDKIDFINLDRTGLPGLTIGSRCFIGRETMLDLAGKITLADWVTISPRAIILSHLNVGFKHHPLLKLYPPGVSQTRLKTGCFIGTNAVILHGVSIGEKALVGAGSVVTQSVSRQTLVVGSPATVKKRL